MIPKGLQCKHFKKAAEEIDRDGVPKRRASSKYDLLLDGNYYPPKYMISIANKYLSVNVMEWSSDKFVTGEAIKYFRSNGYTIIDKNARMIKIISEDEESNFPEGENKYRWHRHLERDSDISKKAKKKRLKEVGELRCDVCDFSFSNTYGKLGVGYIEAHHTIPVSKIKGSYKTKIKDIALVCSNCHRMLHSNKKLLSIEQLREVFMYQDESFATS